MGRTPVLDTRPFFCPYEDCDNHNTVGPDNHIIGAGHYGNPPTQLLRCTVCGRRFSARRGTPLFQLKASEETFYRTMACLAEGNGVRATARIMGLDKDTVSAWLARAARHVQAVSRYLMVNLHFEEVQLDEFWNFVKKKKPTAPRGKSSRKNMVTSGYG